MFVDNSTATVTGDVHTAVASVAMGTPSSWHEAGVKHPDAKKIEAERLSSTPLSGTVVALPGNGSVYFAFGQATST
jgi:hypothetical protein